MASTSSSTELVCEEPERRSLQKPFIKSNTKKSNYGSLRKEVQQTANVFIVNYKHKIQIGETLQGISLKYGLPIENIKRANRLWSNDLAFVKETLLIPLDRDKIKEMNLDERNFEAQDQANNLNKNSVNLLIFNGDKNNNNLKPSKDLNSLENQAANEAQNEAFKDYLNKFDTFLNESKIRLKTLETNSNLTVKKSTNGNLKVSASSNLNNSNHYADDESDDLFMADNKRLNLKKTVTMDDSSCLSDSNGNLNSIPEFLITSPNKYLNFYSSNHNLINGSNSNSSRARLAQENLQRLEKEKDDLYEL